MPRCGAPLVRALCGAAGPGRAPRAPARRRPAGGPAGSPPRWPPPPLPRVLWPCLRAAFAVRGSQRRPAWRSHRPTRRWDRRHVRLAGGIAGAALAAGGTRRCRLPPARARLRALSVGRRSRPPVCVLGWPCPQHRQRTGGRHAPAFPLGSRPAGRRFTSATRAAPPAPLASTSAPRRRRVTVTLSPCALPHVLPERHHGTGCSRPPAGALHGVRTGQAPPSPGFPGGAVRPPPRGCSERVPRGARPRPPAPPDVQCGFFFTWPCVLPVNASGWLRSHACERERSGTSRPDGTCGHGPSTSPFHGPWRQRAAGAWLCSPMTGVAGGVVTAALST